MGDAPLRKLQRDWEDLGVMDPLWAILTHEGKRNGRWDLADFLATGERHIAEVMARAKSFGLPGRQDRALDFGCGIGRLTRPLAARFGEVVGVDISRPMIEKARLVNADLANCSFLHNARPDLAVLADGSFDFVYTHIVLMHLPSRRVAQGYLRELVRVLTPGGLLIFQMPAWIAPRWKVQSRQRLYSALRFLRLGSRPLYDRLGLHPIRMIDLPESIAVRTVVAAGGEVVAIDHRAHGVNWIDDRVYFVVRPEPGPGYPPPGRIPERRD
jgi:SAM-dependent methyltransferase